jgi:16S rRNA (cytosine967-C5)-methyltransferase
MSHDNFRPAREVGLKVLELFDNTLDDAAGILRRNIDRTPERSFVTDMVFGVIRNRLCLDNIIFRVSDVTIDRVSRELVNILRMGLYELVYCPDREVYAVVSETMKQTDQMSEKQKGFVNAILRKACRLIAERSVRLAIAPAKMTVPVTHEKGCRFSIDVLADPAQEPVAYLSEAFSLPRWLVERWIDSFGFKDAMGICFGSNRRPSIYIRPNTLKGSGMSLFQRFCKEEIDCEMIINEGLLLQTRGGRPIEKLPGYAEGLFSVQDITSSEAVRMMGLQPGWRVLDLCAAPGGKTIQMAEVMGDAGEIYATDIDAARLQLVTAGVERMQVNSVKVIPYAEVAAIAAGFGGFDAVLLDVPCSNTGVMARRCEVRYRLTSHQIDSLVKMQRNILAGAATLVRPGGRICYSTCSIDNAENHDMVAGFMEERGDFELAAEKLTMPTASRIDRDGGYVAVLRKL